MGDVLVKVSRNSMLKLRNSKKKKHENQARAKAENSKKKLQREIDEINDRLEEAGGATAAQMELNKKREGEVARLKRDIEESNIQHEAVVAAFRKKHTEAVTEMSE